MIVHGWQIHVGLHRELGRLYPAVGLVVHNVGGPHRRPIRPVGGGQVKLGLAGAGQFHGSKGARHYGRQLRFAVGFGWPVATPSRVAQFVPILISISLLTFGNDSKGRSQDFLCHKTTFYNNYKKISILLGSSIIFQEVRDV